MILSIVASERGRGGKRVGEVKVDRFLCQRERGRRSFEESKKLVERIHLAEGWRELR
jgi:hypothetical protein